MKIALIGASGFVGSAILQEAVSRGHQVTAIVRDVSKVAAHPRVTAVAVDAQDSQALARVLKGHDRVISAWPGLECPGHLRSVPQRGQRHRGRRQRRQQLAAGGRRCRQSGNRPGRAAGGHPEFPAEWKQGALAARDGLTALRRETTSTGVSSPHPVFLEPGEKRGGYRLGTDQVLFSGEQPAGITVGDLADGVLNEAQAPAHLRQRFTLGY